MPTKRHNPEEAKEFEEIVNNLPITMVLAPVTMFFQRSIKKQKELEGGLCITRKQKNLFMIMKALALNGPANVWTLSSQYNHEGLTPFPWISVNRYIKELKELGLVIETGKRESIRGKIESKVYGLSLYGLWVTLCSKDVESQFQEVINIYRRASSEKYPKEELDTFVQLYYFIRDIASIQPTFPIRNWSLPSPQEIWSKGYYGSIGYFSENYLWWLNLPLMSIINLYNHAVPFRQKLFKPMLKHAAKYPKIHKILLDIINYEIQELNKNLLFIKSKLRSTQSLKNSQ